MKGETDGHEAKKEGEQHMILKNGRIVNGQFRYEFADIQVENGVITAIGKGLPEDGEAVDCTGLTVIPGLCDVHTHECVGCQLSECTQESLERMAGFYARNGVTSYLATVDSQDNETLEHMCRELGRYRSGEHPGAVIRGVHIEGMFFSKKRRGGHPEELLMKPDIGLVRRLNELCGGAVRMVCVAPELEGARPFIQELSKEMTVSIAHTDASYEQAMEGLRWGAKSFTHLFNGMAPLHHREPGTAGAALDSPEAYREIIADGLHLHPAAVRMVAALSRPDRLVLISDSCVATGLEDGVYEIGSKLKREIVVEKGLARLKGTDTICGSTFCLYQMFKNAVMKIGLDFMTALMACTINPARLAGLEGEIGSIDLGKSGDLVVIGSDMKIRQVYVKGQPQLAGEEGEHAF